MDHERAFISMFMHRLENHSELVQRSKQHCRKVLLSNFHFNGYTLGFHSQAQKLELQSTLFIADTLGKFFFSQTSVNYFAWDLVAVCNSEVSARREFTVP